MVSISYVPPSPWSQIGQGLGSIGQGYMQQQNWQQEMNQQKRRLDIMETDADRERDQNTKRQAADLAKILEDGSQQPIGSPGRGFTGLKLKALGGFTPEQVDDFVNNRSGNYPQTYTTDQYLAMTRSDITALQQKGAVGLAGEGIDLSTKEPTESVPNYRKRVQSEMNSMVSDLDRQVAGLERMAPETTTYEIGKKGTAAEGQQTSSTTKKEIDEGALNNLKELRDFRKRVAGACSAMAQTKGYKNFWDEIKGSGLSPTDIPNWRDLKRPNLLLNEIKKWMKENTPEEVMPEETGDLSVRRKAELAAKEGNVPQWVVGLSADIKEVVFEFRAKGMSWEQIKSAIR